MIRKIPQFLRILAGFLPVLNPGFLIFVMMNDFTNVFMFRPWLVPWEMWLWLAASVGSAVLLCYRRLIPLGLITGSAPYLVILIQSFSSDEAEFLRIFAVCCLTFFIAYAVCYYTYHRELNKS